MIKIYKIRVFLLNELFDYILKEQNFVISEQWKRKVDETDFKQIKKNPCQWKKLSVYVQWIKQRHCQIEKRMTKCPRI